MFSKLQYISQGNTANEQIKNIQEALDGGCTWIQLRFKKAQPSELLKVAAIARKLCYDLEATFIVNDHADIAKAVHADGVHLGLQDMPVAEAKKIVGDQMIIGGTANTFEDVLQRYREGCHYVGVGPFRFTKTKEKLSPVLGLPGYEILINKMNAEGISIPLYAIGGILPEDVESIMQTGLYGIAISGAITHHDHKKQIVQQLNSSLYAKAYNR
ncbi:thiamine phosphate synthase [Chitinophagaceae bacterium LB-8]|uniref:Thiamine-phosphate synthase n=1 Tax=Paraflavisolibacter caeni TaxID=2982496 RepID=A0A9X2XTE5_9BACT|nr:thiamine phosphate synthase [Paraflavisolibacter caeni]MCU7548112.1 thiamine phosphate synthase [Paraflavisolibacter caeni]